MEQQPEDRNRYQIIRKDGRGCFVESQSDWFPYHKAHLQFVAYDISKAAGSRYTSNINIYINIGEFLVLTASALNGFLHMGLCRHKEAPAPDSKPVFERLGGTSAERLRQMGQSRKDGKSLSRVVKLIYGKNSDFLFVADSGPGEADSKGLIVPRFGKSPENHVAVPLTESNLQELLLLTQVNYQAWLAAQYAAKSAGCSSIDGREYGKENGRKNGKVEADDTQIF